MSICWLRWCSKHCHWVSILPYFRNKFKPTQYKSNPLVKSLNCIAESAFLKHYKANGTFCCRDTREKADSCRCSVWKTLFIPNENALILSDYKKVIFVFATLQWKNIRVAVQIWPSPKLYNWIYLIPFSGKSSKLLSLLSAAFAGHFARPNIFQRSARKYAVF